MKSIMKFSVVSACVMLLFANCSKPKDFSTSYLRGKIDGVVFECNKAIKAHKPMPVPGSGTGSDPDLIITGEWPMYSIKLNINNEGTSISTNSYTFQTGKCRTATLVWNGTDSYQAGNYCSLYGSTFYGSGRITVLEIDKNYIKGNFEFTTEVNGTTGLSKNVTDGEFYIKRS